MLILCLQKVEPMLTKFPTDAYPFEIGCLFLLKPLPTALKATFWQALGLRAIKKRIIGLRSVCLSLEADPQCLCETLRIFLTKQSGFWRLLLRNMASTYVWIHCFLQIPLDGGHYMPPSRAVRCRDSARSIDLAILSGLG